MSKRLRRQKMVDEPSRIIYQQFAVMATIVGVTTAIAFAGLGVPARLTYMMMAAVTAAWYVRRSPWPYLTFTFWIWTITPLVRRVINFRTGWDATDFILATPNIIALFMIPDIITSRKLLRLPEFGVGLLVLLPILYGFEVNLYRGEVLAGAVGVSEWLVPLLYYFYIIHNSSDISKAAVYFEPFLGLAAAFTGCYALYQFWRPTPWDLFWAQASGFYGAADRRLDNDYLNFGTLNAGGPHAVWLEFLIILSLRFRTTLMLFSLPLLGIALLLTNVRSALIASIFCLIIAAFMGESHIRKSLLGVLAAVVVIGFTTASFNTEVYDRISKRMGSFGRMDEDYSAQVRAEIIKSSPDLINLHPYGLGIGGLGRGAEVSDNSDLVTVDFGPLAIFLSLGWIGGSLYLIGLLSVMLQAFMAARYAKSASGLAFAICALGLLMNLPFVNIFGFIAAMMWFSAGMAAAYGVERRLNSVSSNTQNFFEVGSRP